MKVGVGGVDVAVVVGVDVVVGVVVVVVAVVVGVVTSQSRKPPFIHSRAMSFKARAVLSHSLGPYNISVNAHSSARGVPPGPRNSLTAAVSALLLFGHSERSTKIDGPRIE